jgi:hypothetical protein
MAEFLESAPGCYFVLGAGNAPDGVHAPHHHPDFDLDERCLPIGWRQRSPQRHAPILFGWPPPTPGAAAIGGSANSAQRLDGR